MGRTREELEAECLHLQFLWEEELFSARPDWDQLEQWNEDLRGLEDYLRQLEFDDLLGGG
jgi:hypothetical protein